MDTELLEKLTEQLFNELSRIQSGDPETKNAQEILVKMHIKSALIEAHGEGVQRGINQLSKTLRERRV